MNDVFLARQPICDRRRRVVAYELLYSSGPVEQARAVPGDSATAIVAVNSIMTIGLDRIVGHHAAYLNLTEAFLIHDHYRFLPRDRVVLEVLEDVDPTPAIIEALGRAREHGYAIALDDWVVGDRREPLLEFADVVKVEVPQLREGEAEEVAQRLRAPGRLLLAEKVESYAEFDHFCAAGYDLFQGFFHARPQRIQGRDMPVDRLSLLELLARIHAEDAEMEEIQELVERNVALSYKLLRYVNSVLHGLLVEVESIRHAIVMLGLRRIRTSSASTALGRGQCRPLRLMSSRC